MSQKQSKTPKAVPEEKNSALPELEKLLGHTFASEPLLREALTHASLRYEEEVARKAAGEKPRAHQPAHLRDNERLEFLGDAIIGLLVADSLFRRFKTLREGELTRLRAALVSRKHLGEVGEALELGRWMRFGRGEERNGGRHRAVLLANCVEAVTAALYLDTNSLDAARNFVEQAVVEPYVTSLFKELQNQSTIGDYKTALQELLQARGIRQPEYHLTGTSGPDHRKRFLVEVRLAPLEDSVNGKALARGSGSTKKKAEQEAARRAIRKIDPEQSKQDEAEPTPPSADAETAR